MEDAELGRLCVALDGPSVVSTIFLIIEAVLLHKRKAWIESRAVRAHTENSVVNNWIRPRIKHCEKVS